MTERVLLIDDDRAFLDVAEFMLRDLGYTTFSAESVEEAVEKFVGSDPAIVLLDWQLGDSDGIDLIGTVIGHFPFAPVVLVTSYSTTEIAVRAIQMGAFDFLPKPLEEARLVAILGKAIKHNSLLIQVAKMERGEDDADSFEGLLGQSSAMLKLFELIRNVAPTDASVMIQGESGTGKELVARAIHSRSKRKDGSFLAVNMAALPSELVESTLFGHERGAFTGAAERTTGLLEEASGGTLFLDEITEMPIERQPKLLRVLEDRHFRRVGGREDIEVDIRVVSATNRDPIEAIRMGKLRSDLYYRLHVVPITISPLRERPSDIGILATTRLLRTARSYERSFKFIDPPALSRLESFYWPGNVRQLMNLIEACVVLNEGEILTENMFPKDIERMCGAQNDQSKTDAVGELTKSSSGPDEIVPLSVLEKNAIERALVACGGSATKAAVKLEISTATIYRKIRSYEVR